ncbi:serine hydrolase domain-containing protein [Chryseobacterium oryctis]|uniref:Beta-lactamase family protein n=1 Tax=Chryseobacterium oryctis TaxID=2952618 RepID=A0ABT3HQP8_9FLAO|nr:serine hydrolase domain-containing protein [Chryseobacterium oryctis]MCW3162040.1 beta-lactamase family protein [Chryseobacterium oryctis]
MQKLKILSIISFVLLSLGCKNTNEADDYQTNLDNAIKNIHDNLQKELNTDIPSLSVYVVSPKGTFFSSVLGANGAAVSKKTYFRFASNTKNFTSTAILKMMQDGWLNIDDKITANIPGTSTPYVPNTADWNFPHKNEITIRQLLQHNAGIYDITNDSSQYNVGGETYTDYMLSNSPNHQFSTGEYIKLLTDHNLSYGAPNTVYHYSNTGFSILGEIISRVYSQKSNASKTYGNYMYDHIVGSSAKVPLGIKFPELGTDQQLPVSYIRGFIKYADHSEITDKINASAHIGEGNGVGTMEMLTEYIRTLMKGENVLNSTSIQQMKTSKGASTTNNYALGCSLFPGIGYGHNGATEGYLSLMTYDPDTDVSIIVLFPFWDLRSTENFNKCLSTLNTTGLEAKKALGY